MDTNTNGMNTMPKPEQWIAFAGMERIAQGSRLGVAAKVKERLDRDSYAMVLVFDSATSERVELDLRGTIDDVVSRLEIPAESLANRDVVPALPEVATGPGRPKLGVVAREVTLLPRHWDWLNGQPGGASVALRKLVEEARRTHAEKDRIRLAQESAYRFLSAIAGDLRGFQEALRALFAGQRDRFAEIVEPWPVDVRDHALTLAGVSFGDPEDRSLA